MKLFFLKKKSIVLKQKSANGRFAIDHPIQCARRLGKDNNNKNLIFFPCIHIRKEWCFPWLGGGYGWVQEKEEQKWTVAVCVCPPGGGMSWLAGMWTGWPIGREELPFSQSAPITRHEKSLFSWSASKPSLSPPWFLDLVPDSHHHGPQRNFYPDHNWLPGQEIFVFPVVIASRSFWFFFLILRYHHLMVASGRALAGGVSRLIRKPF